jgi:MFS family permease
MTMSFESLFPVLSRDRLGMDDSDRILGSFSYLMVGFGAAALVAAVTLAGVRTEAARGRLLLWFGVLSGVAPVALAMSPNLPLAILAAAGMGFSQGGFMVLAQAMVQSIAPDAIRGRVMGVYNWHIFGFMASFNLVNGALAGMTALTAPIILGAGGIGFLVVITSSLARIPLRQLYARGVPAT